MQTFKARFAFGWSMVEEQVFDLLILMALCCGLWLIRDLKNHVDQAIEDLDTNLATALQATIGNLAGNIEPPNPFHQLIAQWMQNQGAPVELPIKEIVERDAKGLFSKKD